MQKKSQNYNKRTIGSGNFPRRSATWKTAIERESRSNAGYRQAIAAGGRKRHFAREPRRNRTRLLLGGTHERPWRWPTRVLEGGRRRRRGVGRVRARDSARARAGAARRGSADRCRLFLPQPRRGGLRRDAGRSHGPGRRAVAQGHRHRHQHLYRPRALQRLGQGRSPLHAGAVESRRAEPGLSAAADARAALSRRHRGDERTLPQDLWRPHVRPPDRSAARGSAARSLPSAHDRIRQRSLRRARSGPRSIRA